MLQQVYGDDCLSRTQCHEWYQRFKSGNVHRRRPQIWTAFHVNGRRSRWETACCDSSKSLPKCPWSCRRSRNLQKFLPPDFDRKTKDASCCRKICSASVDASLLIHEFLTKHKTTVVPQPPYSPDLDPAEFFLFPKWKSSLKRRRFQTVEEIEENSIRDLRAIPQNTYQDAFQKWKKTFWAAYQEWRGVLWRWQGVWLSYK